MQLPCGCNNEGEPPFKMKAPKPRALQVGVHWASQLPPLSLDHHPAQLASSEISINHNESSDAHHTPSQCFNLTLNLTSVLRPITMTYICWEDTHLAFFFFNKSL